MRSDLRDNTDTINKMIQFGTVKYGIVKQLKDRTRSERDLTSDQEEDGSSIACSPVAECKSESPEIQQTTLFNNSNHHPYHNDEDHNHNNNISENNHDENYENDSSTVKTEPNDTYPELELNHKPASSPSPSLALPVVAEELQAQQLVQEEEQHHHHHNQQLEHLQQSQEQQQQQQQQQEQQPPSEHEHQEQQQSQISRSPPHDQDEDLNMSDGEDDHENGQANGSLHSKNDELLSIPENPNSGSGLNSPPPTMPQFPTTPMTLEAIQSMQIAIAQFATKTLANGGPDNETAMKQLAILQQTLFNLQQQQIFQMQLIQQLRSQLAMNQPRGDDDQENNEEDEDIDEEEQNCAENLITTNQKSEENHKDTSESMDVSMHDEEDEDNGDIKEDDIDADDNCDVEGEDEIEGEDDEAKRQRILQEERSIIMENHRIMQNEISALSALSKQDENTPLPYGSDLASSIITNHDHPPSLDEPNSLEMLQKRAQEVLESASQGILAGNLADEFAFGKDKNGDGKNRNEPFFKHRCRYCGKVFGSDSALQIHIRSHTGERPFKCNVCGSRFTTKGNLKVHFQRHAQKFPHVPMNSTPIPEHLDKYHPPLLEQMSPETSPQHQPQMPHPNVPVSLPLAFPPGAGFPGLPMYRPPLEILKSLGPYPNPFFSALPPMPPKREQELPTDLRKPSAASSPNIKDEDVKDEPMSLRIKEEREVEVEVTVRPKSITPPPPPQTAPAPSPVPPPPSQQLQHHQEQPQQEQQQQQQLPSPPHLPQSLHPQQQPPPPPLPLPLPPTSTHLPPSICRDDLPLPERLPLNYTKTSPERRSPICSPASIPRSPFLGPMKPEMTLLPRPHSNDNSWENFIEVSNTSETVKLKELMKNKKLTDPNQCVVCDRVLSCKSALQMHYRTHTGERPFKCRICGRAFTTKGNLKTHMAVHKIRPPMRNFHQCPVCHKKYSNALVLQQHIRLHTGEPTDLTPEQIQAAEIRDFPPSMMPGSFLNPFAFNFGIGNQNGTMGSESSQGDNDDVMDCSDDFDDEDISDHMSNGGDSDRPKSRDDMKGMLFEQKLKIENNRPKSEASTSSAPTSPISQINKLSPAPSDTSQGALDLTPRSSLPLPNPAAMMPQRPPFGMFPNLPLFPPVSSTTHNMCSAMNSIAQSVMPSAPFNPLALSGVRGSTTCGICFKTFPCHSALEIHYRSHTKERPFKCSICDRGFTTKGNLKQHMLTHKIRDMEQDAFRNRAVKYMNSSTWKEGFE